MSTIEDLPTEVLVAGRKSFDLQDAVERAMLAFWRAGFTATSLEVLTAATGLGRGSLYATFGSKDELFQRALACYSARYEGRFADALDAHANPVAAIEAFFAVTLERIADPTVPNGCLVARSLAEVDQLSPASADLTRAALGRQRGRVRGALGRGRVPDDDAEALATHLTATNQSLAIMSLAGYGAGELQDVVEASLVAVSAATRAQRRALAATGHGTGGRDARTHL